MFSYYRLCIFAFGSYQLTKLTLRFPLYVIYSQVDRLDDRRRKEMGDKLVMHCKGPKETVVRYNRYVVNGKQFYTLAYDVRKRT
jgi:hypothetical protein